MGCSVSCHNSPIASPPMRLASSAARRDRRSSLSEVRPHICITTSPAPLTEPLSATSSASPVPCFASCSPYSPSTFTDDMERSPPNSTFLLDEGTGSQQQPPLPPIPPMTPPAEWVNEWGVGNNVIDAQHYHLFCIVQSLKGVHSCQSLSELTLFIEKEFAELSDYAQRYFIWEDQIMINCQYPGREEHLKQHARFSAELSRDLQSWRRLQDLLAIRRLEEFLSEWLTRHCLVADRHYIDYSKAEPVEFVIHTNKTQNP